MSIRSFQQFPFQFVDLLSRQIARLAGPRWLFFFGCLASSRQRRTLRSVVPSPLAIPLIPSLLCRSSNAFWRRFVDCSNAPGGLMHLLSYNSIISDILMSKLSKGRRCEPARANQSPRPTGDCHTDKTQCFVAASLLLAMTY